MKQQVVVPAPAKINLTLDVKGRRSDGYHELETVMHQISLTDSVTVRAIPQGIQVDTDHPLLPVGEENLAYQAAREILELCAPDRGAAINIRKRIPIGAGLAGGSADAAAVLRGINGLYDCGLSPSELLVLGARLGSDVPFCIQGGTALAKGRGEELHRLPGTMRLNLVLVKPDFSVSTAEVYRRFSLSRIKNRPDTEGFLAAWHHCDMIGICTAMENVLETVTASQYEEIQRIKSQLVGRGALKALMSGSGPAVFGLFSEVQTAQIAWRAFQAEYRDVFLVSSYDGSES